MTPLSGIKGNNHRGIVMVTDNPSAEPQSHLSAVPHSGTELMASCTAWVCECTRV